MAEQGPFTLSTTSAPFAIVPGLVLMFTLAPAAVPDVPLPLSALIFGFIGAVVGLLVYQAVRAFGPLARIGALVVLCLVLWGVSALLLGATA
jgi:hypothetical protein